MNQLGARGRELSNGTAEDWSHPDGACHWIRRSLLFQLVAQGVGRRGERHRGGGAVNEDEDSDETYWAGYGAKLTDETPHGSGHHDLCLHKACLPQPLQPPQPLQQTRAPSASSHLTAAQLPNTSTPPPLAIIHSATAA